MKKRIYNRKDHEKANLLSSEGRVFSSALRNDNVPHFNRLKGVTSDFATALAISLTWTKHALHKDEFIDYAANFIDGKIAKDEDMVNKNVYRFSVESLNNAITGYRIIMKELRKYIPNFNTCSVDELTDFQHKMLSVVNRLKESGKITGIGAWLFLGPFKITIGHHERLWDDLNLNNVILPTGMEVERGLTKLKKENHTFMKDFELSWLEQGYEDFLDSYTTCTILHDRIKIIGEATDTSAFHINSALYLYGRNEI